MERSETTQITDDFVRTYQALGKDNLSILADLYHQNVVFEDPAHRVEGIEQLTQYFARLFQSVTHCEFQIHETITEGQVAYVQWTMLFSHPKIAKGQQRQVNGCSRLAFSDGKVIGHRDYFDMGEMIYEGVPLMGPIVRHIKASL